MIAFEKVSFLLKFKIANLKTNFFNVINIHWFVPYDSILKGKLFASVYDAYSKKKYF